MDTASKWITYIFSVGGGQKPWGEGQDEGDEAYESLNGPGGRNLTGSVNDKRICVPQKIDPKTFFANERTFLKWLSISVMIGMLSLSLLNFGDTSNNSAELAGLILLPVSIFFMLYSLIIFKDRAQKIYLREPMRYDDTRGPTLLVIVLCVSLLMATIFSLQRDYVNSIPSFSDNGKFS